MEHLEEDLGAGAQAPKSPTGGAVLAGWLLIRSTSACVQTNQQQSLRVRGELELYNRRKLLRTCHFNCFLIPLAHISANFSALSATGVAATVCSAAIPLVVFGSRADLLLASFNRALFFASADPSAARAVCKVVCSEITYATRSS